MAIRYHFSMSCKRIEDVGWTISMKADQGEIPMSIVQPESDSEPQFEAMKTSNTLTTEPITQQISDTAIVVRYLRQLNRCSSRQFGGHNDAVIWNLGLRLPKLLIGQKIDVGVFYFSNKGLGSGIYEIQLLGAFPENLTNIDTSQQSAPGIELRTTSPNAPVTEHDDNQSRIPEQGRNTISQLVDRLEYLQDELLTIKETLAVVSEKVEQLEMATTQLNLYDTDIMDVGQSPQAHVEPPIGEPSESAQEIGSSEEAENESINTDDDGDEPDLFEYLGKARANSGTLESGSTSCDLETTRKLNNDS